MIYLEDVELGMACEQMERILLEWVVFLERYATPKECQYFLEIHLLGKSVREVAQREGVSTEGLRWRMKKFRQKLQDVAEEQKI